MGPGVSGTGFKISSMSSEKMLIKRKLTFLFHSDTREQIKLLNKSSKFGIAQTSTYLDAHIELVKTVVFGSRILGTAAAR